jgi:hypothetical protein
MPHFPCVLPVFSYSVSVTKPLPLVEVTGIGLNATDTIVRLPHFPAFNSKVEFRNSEVLPGGQVASAVTACARWGLKTRYAGKIGEDSWGDLQRGEMKRAGVEAHWRVVPGSQSQSSFILVDEQTGERTVLWKRDARLELLPREIRKEWVTRSRLLHVDGHDCRAAATAAKWARQAKIPVTADLDNLYPGVEVLLENVDFAITSRDFPGRLFKENDLFVSLRAGLGRLEFSLLPRLRHEAGGHDRRGRYFSWGVCLRDRAGHRTDGPADILLRGRGAFVPWTRSARGHCPAEEN